MPNEEFYSSATIARPTAEPKETNPEEPPTQVAASKEASNETQGKFKGFLLANPGKLIQIFSQISVFWVMG